MGKQAIKGHGIFGARWCSLMRLDRVYCGRHTTALAKALSPASYCAGRGKGQFVPPYRSGELEDGSTSATLRPAMVAYLLMTSLHCTSKDGSGLNNLPDRWRERLKTLRIHGT